MSSVQAWLGAIAGKYFFTTGRATRVESLAEHFIAIDVQGDGLSTARWEPGDKVQIFIRDVGMRTYTPLWWDTSSGRTRYVVYTHGDAPGSNWARALRVDDTIEFFGPRRSIRVSHITQPLVVFGDETSVAVASALLHAAPLRSVQAVFETSVPDEVAQVAEALGLSQLALTERGDTELAARRMAQAVGAGAFPIFTGRAASIQRLKRALAAHPGAPRGETKAYWADGKVGLD